MIKVVLVFSIWPLKTPKKWSKQNMKPKNTNLMLFNIKKFFYFLDFWRLGQKSVKRIFSFLKYLMTRKKSSEIN